MANLQVTCVPKNPELLWLQGNQNQHRSYHLFTNQAENPLKARRCSTALYEHIENNDIHEEVWKYIESAGFGGIFKAGYQKIDHQLIIALVERWRPETHTFHFPMGEATVTLQDVQVIWGLPIDGPPVSGTWAYQVADEWIVMCQDFLGFVPEEVEELNEGRIKISTLVEHLSDELSPNEEAYQQRARTYILAMLAGMIFVDSNQYDVSLNYLENIEDLSIEGRQSWGSAVIAYLYRNLCKATLPNTKGIQGPLLLLQYWAWERMPHIAPRIIDEGRYNYQFCYAARWNYSHSHIDTPAHVRVAYRSTFTALTDEQFRWTPYQGIIHLLPEDCRSGQQMWTYSGWVVYWNTVEPHLAHRVARQFGYIQAIPIRDGLLSPHEHTEVHGIRRSGSRNTNWVQKLQKYIDQWTNRHSRIFQGVEGVTTTGDYMQWSYDRTVLCITNPGQRDPDYQYPSWGSETQLLREGMREISSRARNIIGRDPTQSQAFQEFAELPENIMQYSHRGERMGYASQNFDFPASAYHQGTPAGGFHQGTSGGGFQQGTPGGGFHQGTSGGGFHQFSSGGGGFHQFSSGRGFHQGTPYMNFATPSPSTQNLFCASGSTFAPDYAMDPLYQRFETGRQMRRFSPVLMPDLNTPGTTQQATTNLANDEDVVDVQQHNNQQSQQQFPSLALQRGRRDNINPPPCGTGGHYTRH